jgi:aminobenzoyl-glutamate utilization protein B
MSIRPLGAAALIIAAAVTPHAQAPAPAAKTAVVQWLDANASTWQRINRNIWSYAETGLEETRSAQELMTVLKENGFTVEAGVAGMPTAFVASYGSGRPIVGILAEYDALPGLSQDASPERKERAGAGAGHGCGHSVFGTASTAAAIAAKRAIESGAARGTIRLYGTPAEETGIGKTYMLREGLFKDADAILSWHAGDTTTPAYNYTKANVSVKFRFAGLPAHASASPHQGRSALDAVELMNVGVNYMREHVKEDTRIHYVVTNGGGQPNVVPPSAEVWYYLRADKHADVEEYFTWLREIAEGAARMTRTKLETVQVDADMHEVLPNRALALAIHRNLEQVGPPKFTDEEKAFARQTQAPLGRTFDRALSEVVEPMPQMPGQGVASTDVGDISWFVPVGQLTAATHTFGAPGHSWQVVACTGTSIGEKGMMVAAKALAATAIDLFTTPSLVEQARADFKSIREPLNYVTLIPEGQKAPKSIR